jgi:predicted transcriptional regulator
MKITTHRKLYKALLIHKITFQLDKKMELRGSKMTGNKKSKCYSKAVLLSFMLILFMLSVTIIITPAEDIIDKDEPCKMGTRSVRGMAPPLTFDVPVHLGYNLISLPLVAADTSIINALNDDGGDTTWDYALWYDPLDEDHWKTYGTFRPESLNDLNNVTHMMGIVLNVSNVGSDGCLRVRGPLPETTTMHLYKGLNLVGFPAHNDSFVTVGDVKAVTGNRITSIEDYLEVPYDDGYVLKRGEGYKFRVSENCTWTIPDNPLTFDIPVQLGYNLISVPLIQANQSILAVLGDNGGDTTWDYALWYDPLDEDHWKTHGTFRPASLNDLNNVNHSMGIILNISNVGSDGCLNVRGALPTTTSIYLYAGRNLVGFPAINDNLSITIGDIKAATGNIVTSVENRQEMPYDDDYVLKRGDGYYLCASENCTWFVNELIPQEPISIVESVVQEATVGDVVNFNGNSSYDQNGSIVDYLWDFGDGENGTGRFTAHIFTFPGNFTITLRVVDHDGLDANSSCQVTIIDNLSPIISNVVIYPIAPTNRDEIIITCNVTDNIGLPHANFTYLYNGTDWRTIQMVNIVPSMYQATLGPLNQNFTFYINCSDTTGNIETYSDNISVKKAIIEATSENLFPDQIPEPGATVRITGNVLVDGKINTTGLFVIAWLNGEELGICQIDVNGTYLLEFVVPEFETDNITIDIQLVDFVGGEVLVLESMVLSDNHSFSWFPIIFGSAIGFTAILALFTEVGKYAFLLLIIPLYSKLRKDEVLDLYIRGKIHGYILANPGEHYNAIKKALKINNGSLAYHLSVLEKEEIIKSRTFGIYKRFYPMDMIMPDNGNNILIEVQKLILVRIEETPGITQKDLAKLLGISPSTINYHINKLVELDKVRTERKGKWTKYYLTPKPAVSESNDKNT